MDNTQPQHNVTQISGPQRDGMPREGEDEEQINADLHGFVPDKCRVALLLIDLINDMEFEGGEELYKFARPMADRVKALKERCESLSIPVIYVNDNFGRWQSDFRGVVEHVTEQECRGRDIARMLAPGEDDYFVLKPKHSGFYSTTLDLLLKYLDTKTLIMCGVAGDMCVLFTANDAYMRDFEVIVPRDGMASETPESNDHAIDIMNRVLKAQTPLIEELDLEALSQGCREPREN
jgi:nicotinamidase-related amidase